jgi:hypothetical protein
MSDLIEQQLRDLFAAEADAAPRPADLVMSTRRAARSQRLRTGAWALAASVVAVIAAATAVWPPAPEPVPFPQVASPPTEPVRAPGTLSATPGYGPGTRLSMRPVAQVLDLAAGTAAKAADVLPDPGQFLYTRTVGRDGRILTERWFSIDGTRDGLGFNVQGGEIDRFAFPGCRDGRYVSGPDQGGPCEADPAYLPDLPEEAESMARYLNLSNAHRTTHLRRTRRTASPRTCGRWVPRGICGPRNGRHCSRRRPAFPGSRWWTTRWTRPAVPAPG